MPAETLIECEDLTKRFSELEKKSGRKVVTSGNYLALAQAAKKTKVIKR